MKDISRKSLKVLKLIARRRILPEDEIPFKIDRSRLEYLVTENLLEAVTIVPPGKEGYERGLYGYQLTPRGEDAVYKYRKVKVEARTALIFSIVSLLLSLLSTLTPFTEWSREFIESLF